MAPVNRYADTPRSVFGAPWFLQLHQLSQATQHAPAALQEVGRGITLTRRIRCRLLVRTDIARTLPHVADW